MQSQRQRRVVARGQSFPLATEGVEEGFNQRISSPIPRGHLVVKPVTIRRIIKSTELTALRLALRTEELRCAVRRLLLGLAVFRVGDGEVRDREKRADNDRKLNKHPILNP